MGISGTGKGARTDPGSFRDWSNRVLVGESVIYRGLMANACKDWKHLSATHLFQRFTASGKLIPTRVLNSPPFTTEQTEFTSWLQHERIPFISYAYEWPFGMLKDAALLQLELLLAALDEDMTLKDGSPYNVQWLGARPVFIDIPSFTRDGADGPWPGYLQFCQLFLYPLMLTAYKRIPFQPWLKGSLEGIEPAVANALFTLKEWFRPGVFAHVYLQAKLSDRYGGTHKNLRGNVQKAGFNKELVRNNLRRLQKLISGLTWVQNSSAWSHYTNLTHYSDSDSKAKEQFVTDILKRRPRKLVWDLGCNTGNYSQLAALYADYIVAMDGDHLAVEHLYQRLKPEQKQKILPLVTNLVDPSPNRGWRCRERRSLSERGKPNLILCLALIHHLVIGANIPLIEIVSWLASLGEEVIIEFIDKDDLMVRKLLLNKQDQYGDYDAAHFEQYLERYFKICNRHTLSSGGRTLFYAKRLTTT